MIEVHATSTDAAMALGLYTFDPAMNRENVEVVLDWGAASVCWDDHGKVAVTWAADPSGTRGSWAFDAASDKRRATVRNIPAHDIFAARTFVEDLMPAQRVEVTVRDACGRGASASFDLSGFAAAMAGAGWRAEP
jgi:hypothetical protein